MTGLVDTQSVRAVFRRHGLPWPAQFARWARRRGLQPAGTVRIGRATVALWHLDQVESLVVDLTGRGLLATSDHFVAL